MFRSRQNNAGESETILYRPAARGSIPDLYRTETKKQIHCPLRKILSNTTISSTTLLFHFTFRSPACVRAAVALKNQRSTFRVVARPNNDRGDTLKQESFCRRLACVLLVYFSLYMNTTRGAAGPPPLLEVHEYMSLRATQKI